MLSRTIRFFSNAPRRSAQDVLASFSSLRNYFGLEAQGCTSAFVGHFPAENIEALKRLFTHCKGPEVFSELKLDENFFKGTPSEIEDLIARKLALHPEDHDENTLDHYAKALECIGRSGGNTRN